MSLEILKVFSEEELVDFNNRKSVEQYPLENWMQVHNVHESFF